MKKAARDGAAFFVFRAGSVGRGEALEPECLFRVQLPDRSPRVYVSGTALLTYPAKSAAASGGRGCVMLGDRRLTPSGNPDLDRAQRFTAPGMVDWVDLNNDRRCASCKHFWKQRCLLFLQIQRHRLGQKFLGPKLAPGQRACRKSPPRTGRRIKARPRQQQRKEKPTWFQ